jgi:magnesium transporter
VPRQLAIVHFRDGSSGEVTLDDVPRVLAERGTLLWIDFEDPTEDDLATLHRCFGFHELALEDALIRGQRPKVDEYEGYYFIVIYSADQQDARGGLNTHELHCFWGANYFVTLHDGPVPEIPAAIARWAKDDHRHGVAYQVYSLLDAVIDGYFPLIDQMAERIDALEEEIFERRNTSVIQQCFQLRRDLLNARRVLAPSRDLLNELIRRDVPVFPRALVPYLVDVHDHAIRVIDTLDLQRDLLSSVLESHLSVTANRLNQTMRNLTSLTVGIMVPTLIAGIYGMNFRFMPELDWPHGYFGALGLMAVSSALTLFIFKRVHWL